MSGVASASAVVSVNPACEYVPGEVLVQFGDDVRVNTPDQSTNEGDINQILRGYSVSRMETITRQDARAAHSFLPRIFKVTIPDPTEKRALGLIRGLRALDQVEFAEPNYFREATAVPDDPRYTQDQAYVLTLMGMPAAWDTVDELVSDDARATIAVIDTGVSPHPDLGGTGDFQGNLWVNEGEIPANGEDDDGNGYVDDIYGWDSVSVDEAEVVEGEDPGPPDGDPADAHGHGTHVAGIMGGLTNNGVGIAGINWNRANIMALRAGFLARDGTVHLTDADIISAMAYAQVNGADVINMSFGGYAPSEAMWAAVKAAHEAGVVLVAATGNDGVNFPFYPCAYPEVVCVSATDLEQEPGAVSADWDGRRSNRGNSIDVSAPGTQIVSTWSPDSLVTLPDGNLLEGGLYATLSGTSQATPFVSGLAGLLTASARERGEEPSNDQIKEIICQNSEDLDPLDWDSVSGCGRIDAAMALENAQEVYPVARITDPLPFTIHNLHADPEGLVSIIGTATGENFQGYSVEYAVGDDPGDDDWEEVISSGSPVEEGELALLDTTLLDDERYTIRLTVWTDDGSTTQLSEDRVSIIVDNHLKEGWPADIPGRPSYIPSPVGESSPVVADLDDDGEPEVILHTGGNGGSAVYVFGADGEVKPGWPNPTNASGWTTPAVGDLDQGYPGLEVVASTHDGRLLGWHADGTPLWAGGSGLPEPTGFATASPILQDIDGNGSLNVILSADHPGNVLQTHVNVYEPGGEQSGGFPVALDGTARSQPAVGDVDGDGEAEILAGTGETLVGTGGTVSIINSDGEIGQTWGGNVRRILLADLDGDGVSEIVADGMNGLEAGSVFVWNVDGSLRWEETTGCGGSANMCSIAVGDINGDGQPEVVASYDNGGDFLNGEVNAWDAGGNTIAGFPRTVSVGPFAGISVGDSDGNALPEILGTGAQGLYILNPDGESPDLFVSHFGGMTGTPTVVDLDGGGNETVVGRVVWNFNDEVKDPDLLSSSPPSSLSVMDASDGEVTLSWIAPETNEDGSILTDLGGYRIAYRDLSGGATGNSWVEEEIGVIPSSVPTYTIGNLTNGHTYEFRVQAYDTTFNDSDWSNTVTVRLGETTAAGDGDQTPQDPEEVHANRIPSTGVSEAGCGCALGSRP